MTVYEENYTPEQKQLAEQLIQIEVDALNGFYNGDTTGYRKLWSQESFSYFDVNTAKRIDRYEEIYDFLMTRVEGKFFVESYEFVAPRVQFGIDMAVLTYHLPHDENPNSKHYNVIEIFQKNSDGEWQVIHSTWQALDPAKLKSNDVVI